MRQMDKRDMRESIEIILQLVGLTNDRHTLSKDLSGGMKRRLSIGISLINDPKVIILDEPTSGIGIYHFSKSRRRRLVFSFQIPTTVVWSGRLFEIWNWVANVFYWRLTFSKKLMFCLIVLLSWVEVDYKQMERLTFSNNKQVTASSNELL